MSFRGRYPSKFRRTGNFHGHGRPVRSRPFKRRYYEEETDTPNVKKNREFVALRGRGRQAERGKDCYLDRGRGRPFNKYRSDRGSRPRSRGRFFRGRQNNFGGSRGKRFESFRAFYNENHGSQSDFHEGNEWDEDERHFNRRDVPSDEWYEGEEEDESHFIEEEHIPFDRRQRSPLTIHRRFDDEEFQHSPQRSIGRSSSNSRSRIRRSPSLERRSFSIEHEQFDCQRSSERRRDSFELRGRSPNIERRDSLLGYRRSCSIDSRERLIEHRRSNSPYGRFETEERGRSVGFNRHSFNRSVSPPRASRSRERIFQSHEREHSIPGTSRRSLERQIAYEKERLQQMLDHEKKIHGKRSESSIERFLDDCKRSFQNNTKSQSVSRSNSFDERDVRMNEIAFERSPSPFDQSRTYKRMENIIIERRRSLERSISPFERPNKYRRISGFSPERVKSPYWREDNKHIIPDKPNIRRRSVSLEYDRRSSSSHNVFPDINKRTKFARRSRSPVFGDRAIFVEQRERIFLDESFLERQESHFLGDHKRDFLDSRNPYYRGEHSSQPRSITGQNHFLGVGEGPFPGNRPFSKDQGHDGFPISQDSGLEKKEKYTHRGRMYKSSHDIKYNKGDILELKMPEENLELSSVSHTSNFEKSDTHKIGDMGLSPISQTESFEKVNLHQNNINRQNKEFPSVSQSNESAKMSKFETERPSSTDSMKQFLAELENDDQSSERYLPQEGDHSWKEACYGQFQRSNLTNKNNLCKRYSNNENEYSSSNKFSNSNISKGNEEISTKTLFTSAQSEKLSSSENTKQDLFNAYEISFLDQSYDAYNENNFQGRYEQSKKGKSENNLAKIETKVAQEKPVASLHFNKTSAFYTQPSDHTVSGRPFNETYDKNYRETQCSLKQESQYYPVSNTMPFGSAVSSLQCSLQMNQSTQISQHPEVLTHSSSENPIFSHRDGNVYNQQQPPWNDQSAEVYNCPGMVQNLVLEQTQPNLFNNSNIPFNGTLNQFGIFPNPQQSQIPNQEVQPPRNLIDNQFSNLENPWSASGGPSKSDSKHVPYVGDKRKKIRKQHNVKEVIVISDDEANVKRNDNTDYNLVVISNGNVIPTAMTVEKYRNCSPTYDVLSKILKGFVIYFGVKENSELQKDPIEVLQESFIKSEGFEKLDVEEKTSSASKYVCQLRWKGLLLSHGDGSSKEEARFLTGIALINALAKTCFTIQTKFGYYNDGRYPKFMLKHPEKPGYYKIVKRDEIIKSVTETVRKLRAQGLAQGGVDATHIDAVISFMDEFFRDPHTHCELIFGPSSGMDYTIGELKTLSRHAVKNGLQIRWFHGTRKVKVHGQFLCVSRNFSPQALFRYMLAEKGDTVRYRMFPPQGPRIDLLTGGNVYNPNMIKSILHLIGPDGNILSDFDNFVDILPHDNIESNTWNETIPSNFGSDQYDDGRSRNIQSNLNSNFPYQNNSSFQNVNTQNREFNSFKQREYSRNSPFQGGQRERQGHFS